MYILLCSNGTYYVGSTKDLIKRFNEHQNGTGSKYTQAHRPVQLLYSEEFDRIDHAFNREKQIQRWSHAKKKALIEGDIEKLRKLASRRG